MDIQNLDKQYVAGTYGRFPVSIVSGKGEILVGDDGKQYIDLGSGIAVNTFGASDEKWKEAVIEQINKIQHTSNLYFTEPCAKLAQMLCEKTGMKKVFFSNSGAEANECAIKCARKYSFDKYGEGRNKIITLKNSFHGRTVTTLAATGQDTFHTDFMPFTEGFCYAEANNLDSVKENLDGVCAIMFECVQGEGGVIALDTDFVKGLEKIAKENDILLISDEVQTGNGRTGKLYGYMNYGITPDIVSTAKGLAGGLPIGATMFSEKTENVLTAGKHGSTFGGNPVCCSAAISVLERIDDALLSEVTKKSEFIINELKGAKGIKSVSGMGLMLGIETEKPAKELANKALEKGVLVLTAKTKLRLLPPLNITKEQIDKSLKILKEIIEE